MVVMKHRAQSGKCADEQPLHAQLSPHIPFSPLFPCVCYYLNPSISPHLVLLLSIPY